jgi:hypothetical protein
MYKSNEEQRTWNTQGTVKVVLLQTAANCVLRHVTVTVSGMHQTTIVSTRGTH